MFVVLASSNAGKIKELRSLLPGWVEVRSAAEVDVVLPEETGSTFDENALLKARAAAEQTGLIGVADDSGLEVDALRGLPGVQSARFAGAGASDEANNRLLLSRMHHVEPGNRTARFRSSVAVVMPDGEYFVANGSVEGEILREPRGEGGFGYDPLFLPSGAQKTMAEMSIDEKNRISHRGQAYREAAKRLIPLLQHNCDKPVG